MKTTLAIIVACVAGGYAGLCVGFIALSVDAAWKGVLQPGYEGELGVIIGILYACIAGALGGVIGTGRFGAYLGSPALGALFVWLCWCVLEDLSFRHLQITVAGLIILTDVALAGALGVAIAKRMVSSPRLQFSLKTLLLLVMMCAVAFSLVGVRGQLRKQWLDRNPHPAKLDLDGLHDLAKNDVGTLLAFGIVFLWFDSAMESLFRGLH